MRLHNTWPRAHLDPTMSSPITCHVLNTLSGTPAANLKTTLTLLAPTKPSENQGGAPQPAFSFHAVTNADGRVKEWEPSSGQTVQSILEPFAQGDKIPFSIKFEIGSWYEGQGVECFWPEIEVKFYIKKGERHYHVPVLVGPWTYTTYRGS
jgi:5-hydroxyisourate hydrolase